MVNRSNRVSLSVPQNSEGYNELCTVLNNLFVLFVFFISARLERAIQIRTDQFLAVWWNVTGE